MLKPFDGLASSTSFEALTFDLLRAEGFSDLVWRGPGPDGGRDIEAAWEVPDPTGHMLRTRWYVECKWYTDSVPFAEIEPKLLAASEAKVDYLLVVTTSRVMNTAMDAVQRWLEARSHPFRVRYWIGTEVLRRISRYRDVFERHFPLHPAASWSDRDADVQRLRGLVFRSTQLLIWRVAPTVQWVSRTLSIGRSEGIKDAVDEMNLLLGTLRLHEIALAPVVAGSPALVPLSLDGVVRDVITAVVRRSGVTFTSKIESCQTVSSRPVLSALLFELMMNAAQYESVGTPSLTLSTTDSLWSIQIRNQSDETILSTWPVLGYRGETAVKRKPGGQGVGATFAQAGKDALKLGLTWTVESGEWVVELSGVVS